VSHKNWVRVSDPGDTIFTLPISKTKLKEFNKKFNVPSAKKFTAVEEATSAITEIVSHDVHQRQGPDTMKKLASLRLNLAIPR
jgi:hypothetical protein